MKTKTKTKNLKQLRRIKLQKGWFYCEDCESNWHIEETIYIDSVDSYGCPECKQALI